MDPAQVPSPEHVGVLLQVAYDGTDFHGWVSSPGARNVYDTVVAGIRAVDIHASLPRGVSRTDAGVHAHAQMVAFDTQKRIPARGWLLGINAHLPDDVAVRRVVPIGAGFVPRFSCTRKRYEYSILMDRVRDPAQMRFAWRVDQPLDVPAMRRAALSALGTHDFAAFRSARDERINTIRTSDQISIDALPDGRTLKIGVEGPGFMYNMVRILVGTLVDIGRGRLPVTRVAEALAARDRRLGGQTAPALGLLLARVDLDLPDGAAEPWP
jgi:tRNA pseudouridine38-40 synthase